MQALATLRFRSTLDKIHIWSEVRILGTVKK